MYGIKAAVRRLEFAPDPKEMKVIHIETGRFVFRPKQGRPVSLADLQESVTRAGYEIERSRIAVQGVLTEDGRLRVPETGQVFLLAGRKAGDLRAKSAAGSTVTAEGAWELQEGEQAILLDEAGPAEGDP